MEAVEKYLSDNAGRNIEELKQLLRIPSISADSKYASSMTEAAEFVRKQLADSGCNAEIVETAGHPIVFGSWTNKPGAPTALVYGHYDVQPPDPLDEWVTPPFEPDVRDGNIYARGATDDKGQMYTHIKSVEAWLKTVGELPVNVKFIIEGEEEVGSDNLDKFLEENKEKCACDIAVVSDTSQYAPGIPAITYGLRGIMCCEVTLHGPNQDLHSGVFGGSITNPVNALATLIGKLIDEQGNIQIPGFYDDVIPLTDEERAAFAALPFKEQDYMKSLGVSATHGEAGYTTLERRWGRPTCDVNGIIGGYTGEGPKTIVPAKATAKISCRLVPNQTEPKIVESLEKFLREQCPPGLKLEFNHWHGCPAVVCDLNSPYMSAAKSAIEKGFGTAPVLIREGGSIPVVGTFKEILGVDTLLLGWGQNTDNLHSPNEKFSLEAFQQGTRSSAWLWNELGGQ
ncbi:MAG: dipeptidase [Planctomicrobium sp.]|jgi:acetylornithine deacetylase/succinyl-diaminopimelate desuccinylase-like protein|nr:dipeptidase [Planctomicrobium sp.]